jgi:hypothetical protein
MIRGEISSLAPDPNPSAEFNPAFSGFLLQVECFYAGLISASHPGSEPETEPGLGGQLFYAGELDSDGRALMVAANIAGAASLAATPDLDAQKQAVRDGVADFLVTSLDEALRILKNQIRKRETVAVCVGAAPETVKREMLERGVLPDLVRPADELSEHSPFLSQGARRISPSALEKNQALLTWSVASAPAQWLPKLDAIALECVPGEDWPARRWLRLSPRYLGRLAQGMRLLSCDRTFTVDFIERVSERVASGEFAVPVEIQVVGQGITDQYRFSPPGELNITS